PQAANEPSRRLRFSRRNLHLALQSTARSTFIHKIYVHPINEKIRTSLILHQESNSCGSFFN
ncbi:hypothetical protein V7170_08215, partial [Priestia megaterium]|uniref:hypothetical protein n=1 Tax=Priestia megaterium TaxID=1404 RepID=UPI00300AB310